jgi:dTDP-4-amino-4,6-dideoxygalactose transaminase
MDINRHRLNRPAVLPGGEPVVPVTPARADDSRLELNDAFPPTLGFRTVNDRRPLRETAAEGKTPEQRYAEMIGRDDYDREAIVIGFSNGAVARTVACVALLTRRFQGRTWPDAPEVVTSVLAPEATLRAFADAHLRPKLVDVDPATGCVSALGLRGGITEETALLAVPAAFDRLPELHKIWRVADSRKIGFLLDLQQSHMAIFDDVHAATYADITSVWGDGSMIDTLGADIAFLVTFDPELADLIEAIRADRDASIGAFDAILADSVFDL